MKEFCQPLLDYISRFVAIGNSTIQTIQDHAREIHIKKGELLFKSGDIAKHSFFMVSGKTRSYYTDYSGKTITWLFHFNEPFSNIKNLFVVDYKSMLTQTPGTMSIEALTDSKVIQLNKALFENVIYEEQALERFIRLLNEKAFIIIYDRIYTLLTMQARERYLKMMTEEGHLLQMFNNYYLASYLGIAPQSLSRIRTQLQHG